MWNKIDFSFLARIGVGGVMIFASLDKIAFPSEFARIVQNYNILPDMMAIPFAYALPWIELILGTFLAVGLFARPMALACSALLSVFMIAVLLRSLEAPLENCGCFAVNGDGRGPSLFILLSRNVLLIALCVYIVLRKGKVLVERA